MFLFWNRTLTSENNAARRTQKLLGVEFINKLDALHDNALRTGLVTTAELQDAYKKSTREIDQTNRVNMWFALGIIAFIVVATPLFFAVISYLLGVRCFLPNNYLVSEATRPISDCRFCRDVKEPLILKNMSREEFAPFAYSSQPIVIRNAVSHWPAASLLNFAYLKDLYARIPRALDEDCQFLPFRSDFKNLRDFFQMPEERINLTDATTYMPWYVGWSNCHPAVLQELRQLYPRPHFLPVDAEMPNTDYIFLGYEQGAFMHLDYIPRLMWQAQLQGNKSWILAPTPECDHICQSFSFHIEPGDAVLVDTRIWYHGTSVPKGQFALTIQSEYG